MTKVLEDEGDRRWEMVVVTVTVTVMDTIVMML